MLGQRQAASARRAWVVVASCLLLLCGAAAAQSLRARAMRAGLSVAVMTPTTPGADWCDVWAQRAAVAVAASEAAA
jgi:hypothetical protein